MVGAVGAKVKAATGAATLTTTDLVRTPVPLALVALDGFLSEQKVKDVYSRTEEEVSALLALSGVCEGGPDDLADNHEQYLRGEQPR